MRLDAGARLGPLPGVGDSGAGVVGGAAAAADVHSFLQRVRRQATDLDALRGQEESRRRRKCHPTRLHPPFIYR